jgi:hypothetical protein
MELLFEIKQIPCQNKAMKWIHNFCQKQVLKLILHKRSMFHILHVGLCVCVQKH